MSRDEAVPRARGSGWKSVHAALRAEILSLVLKPGQLLDEQRLAERFDMSRSPVREALIRLAGEELVVMLANRSTVVAPLDLATLPKYLDALDIAQRVNTRLSAEFRTDEDMRRMAKAQRRFKSAVEGGNHLAMSEANRDFHVAIARAGRNYYMGGFYERLLDQGRRMLHMHFDFLERASGSHLLTDEHDQMLDAIERRDVPKADELAHLHTRQFRDNFIDFLRDNYAVGVAMSPSWVRR